MNRCRKPIQRWKWNLLILVFLGVTSSWALKPPMPGELQNYIQDGSLEKRQAIARQMQSFKINPSLVQAKIEELKALKEGKSFNPETFPYKTGLPAKGNPKVFALLIDFPDYTHITDSASFTYQLFGEGSAANYPYESLKGYYQRSSYGMLTIGGTSYGWYRASSTRSAYGADDYSGVASLIKEALTALNGTVDFSQYDNNGDGKIDYFMVFYAGPHTGWGSIFWAWNDITGSLFADDTFAVDGKRLGVFTFQYEVYGPGYDFEPQTSIHETGHALGLPDYYDYDGSQGPDGGVGGLDMMDSNWGDHNCFSKWLLGWLTPTVVGAQDGKHSLALRPTAGYPDCAMIMPGASSSSPFTEYFMVQNRSFYSNDTYYTPEQAILVWHVDASLNSAGNDFKFDNSYTSHKILRLMEADGLEEIEAGGDVDLGDFYSSGDVFSPTSSPNSKFYSGDTSGVWVNNITGSWTSFTVDFQIKDGNGWANILGDFDLASDTTNWGFELPAGTASIPTISFLSTYQGHNGIMKLNWTTASQGLKLTCKRKFMPVSSIPWYRLKVTYYCDSPSTNQSVVGQLLNYAGNTSSVIKYIGGAYTGNSMITSGRWYSYEIYGQYSLVSAGFLQLILKNGGSNGAMYIDSIELDNMMPTSISSPVWASVPYGDFDVASDTTHWGFQLPLDGASSLPQISWSTGLLVLNFTAANQGVKITSADKFTLPAGRSAEMSFSICPSLSLPTTLTVQANLYAEKDVSAHWDMGAGVSIGNLLGNRWQYFFAPLNSVSQISTYRLQLILKNGANTSQKVYLDNIQLVYSSTALAAQQWVDAQATSVMKQSSLFE